ncbi:MAG: M50 family metallopeptidase [Ardenticatenaceae bacterium]|nr:M50 family metallopeptidase [Ardenticatenaceae bacterium]HBY95414.1 hypothetical protein [Chloroflexota bacterium]
MVRRVEPRPLVVTAATLVVVFLLWESALLAPLKLFVVLFHEISHGLAAILTGGSIERLRLFASEGGVAFTRGGNRFLILSAGYLGSSLWGAALLRLSAAGPGVRRGLLTAMGAALGLIALLYAHDLFTFGYVALAALTVILLALRAPTSWHHWVLYIVGSVSCLYAVVDIGTGILAGGPVAWIFGPRTLNDAAMLAELTGIPAFVWGILWTGIAVAIYGGTVLRLGPRGPAFAQVTGRRSAAQTLLDEIDRL